MQACNAIAPGRADVLAGIYIYMYTLGVDVQFFKIRAKTQKSPKSQNCATHSNVMFHSKVTSVFADSRIALLCHAHIAPAPTESCPFSLLVY